MKMVERNKSFQIAANVIMILLSAMYRPVYSADYVINHQREHSIKIWIFFLAA